MTSRRRTWWLWGSISLAANYPDVNERNMFLPKCPTDQKIARAALLAATDNSGILASHLRSTPAGTIRPTGNGRLRTFSHVTVLSVVRRMSPDIVYSLLMNCDLECMS